CEFHVNAADGQGDRPEEAFRVGRNTRVEVMDLRREVREVILTSVEVQSDESECPFVDGSILAHVDALHEAHVRVEKESFDGTVRVSRGARSLHVRASRKAVEVVNRRRLFARTEEEKAKELPRYDLSVGDWVRRGIDSLGCELSGGREQARADQCAHGGTGPA